MSTGLSKSKEVIANNCKMIVLVTGGSGMVGKCLQDIIKKYDTIHEFVFLSSSDCDLTNIDDLDKIFNNIKPDFIIHLAANVGGLYKNLREKTTMFKDNVRMNENVLEISNKYNIQRGIFCLSSCIFPYNPDKFPMDESMIHDSKPHPSNEGYGYSKRMMEMQCRNYNAQFSREYICLVPVNLYGPYDNFNLEDSHVIPGLIHKFYNFNKYKTKLTIYGSGRPLRQFLFSYDFAKIILMFLFEYSGDNRLVICCNDEISIKSLIDMLCSINGCTKNEITYDSTKSDGCIKKTVSNSLFKKIFPDFEYTTLDDGIKYTVDWFERNFHNCRK